MTVEEQNEMKDLVARHVVERFVRSGMKIGLGSGTTSEYAIRHVGRLLREGKLSDIVAVATSSQAELVCQELRVPLRTLNDPEINGELDLAIDGPDQIDHALHLTKGGGGCMTQEKIVDYAAKRFLTIADETKLVPNLGLTFPIPVEVIPLARVPVTRTLERRGARVALRTALRKMGAVITDNGNMILDISFDRPIDPEEYEVFLNTIPGVVENGIFARKETEVFVAYRSGYVAQVEALPQQPPPNVWTT